MRVTLSSHAARWRTSPSTYYAANRLLTADDEATGLTTYTWDANGNQLSVEKPSGDLVTNTWDGENRTIDTEQPDGSLVTNTYDCDSHRVERDDGVDVIRYVYDGNNVLLQTDDASVTEAAYTLNPQPYGHLVSHHDAAEGSRFYHFDGRHSTSDLTDDSETVTDEYSFDAWGKSLSSTGTTDTPHTFKGELGYHRDPGMDTDEPAYHVHHRTVTGNRFTSEDPAEDDLNQYRYVRNNPLNTSDPSGLGSFYRWLYTGDWNASDEVYRAAREGGGQAYRQNARLAHKGLDLVQHAGTPGKLLGGATQKTLEAVQGPELTRAIREDVGEAEKSPIEKRVDQALEVAPQVAKAIDTAETLRQGTGGVRQKLLKLAREALKPIVNLQIEELDTQIRNLEQILDSKDEHPERKADALREWVILKHQRTVLEGTRAFDGNATEVLDNESQEIIQTTHEFESRLRQIEQENEASKIRDQRYFAAALKVLDLQQWAQQQQKAAQFLQQNRNLLWGIGKGAEAGKDVAELVGTAEEEEAPNRVKQDVYLVGKDGKDLGQLDVFEVDSAGRRVFIEQKDGTGIGKINPSTGKPFRDPGVALKQFGEEHILEAGRRKAIALRDAVATRGDKGAAVPTIQEVQRSKVIRFEVKADTPEMRAEVGSRIGQLRGEFPNFQFEVRYGIQ